MLLSSLLPLALAMPVFGHVVHPLSSDSGIHVPLIRRGPGGSGRRDAPVDLNAVFARLEHTHAKYKYSSAGSSATPSTNSDFQKSLQRRQTQSNANLVDEGPDVIYYAPVSFGTPPQTFNILMDTGSPDLWVITTQCTNCTQGPARLDVDKSSSLQISTSSVTLPYGQGEAIGTLATDNVSLAGFTVPNQTFVAATQAINGAIPSGVNISGIMGLSPEPAATIATRAPPFWQALLNGNQFSNPEFSIFMARNEETSPSLADFNPGGSITFGGRNTTLFQGEVEFQNFPSEVNNTRFWYQNVTSLTLNGTSVGITSGLAAIDTGTSYFVGPPDTVADFWAQVPGSSPLSNGTARMYSYPCNTTLNVTISFGGRSYPINPKDLNVGSIGNGTGLCMGGIGTRGTPEPGDPTPPWIIGDVFLKNVYTVYRASPFSVGFALLSEVAGGPTNSSGAGPASNETTGGAGQNNNEAHSLSPSSLAMLMLGVVGLYSAL